MIIIPNSLFKFSYLDIFQSKIPSFILLGPSVNPKVNCFF